MSTAAIIQPADIDDVSFAFAASVGHLMPRVPPCYAEQQKWQQFQSDWFYRGLKSTAGLKPKDGIDKAKALRHLATIQRSYEPKHEDKEAAVAYLASLWFESDSTWECVK
jgi:hypothetical protein